MSPTNSNVSAPPMAFPESRSSSNSSVPSVTTVLSVTQAVVGVVPIVGTQLQAVLNLALLLAKQLKELQDLHSSEVELLSRVEATISIIQMALNDERSRYDPSFKEGLEHTRSSLNYVKNYLDTRANRTFHQWYRVFLTKGDVKNARDCRDFLDRSLDRLKLVCSIQAKLGVDDLSARMTSLERVVRDTLGSASQPPPSYDSIYAEQRRYRRTGLMEENRHAPGPSFVRSVSPAHGGHARLMSDLSDGEDAHPPKKRRTRRSRRKRAATTQQLRDDDASVVSDAEYLSEGGEAKPGPFFVPVEEQGRGRDMAPSQRKLCRSTSRGRRGNRRHQEPVQYGSLDENYHLSTPTLDCDMGPATNVIALPPVSRIVHSNSEQSGVGVNTLGNVSRPANIITDNLDQLPPYTLNSATSNPSPSTPHIRSRSASPVRTPKAYTFDEKRRRAIFVPDDMVIDLKEKIVGQNMPRDNVSSPPKKTSSKGHFVLTPGKREMQGLLFALTQVDNRPR
ncbi:hypothetical protein SCHPADRAFT_893686 [Schizopora paradoxa]|uniref:Uncharacterized protein n=1 Tax=Schizopora paradoxa TaxID=27342 RepID=A0A0H2RGP1_9AGAM|nr:hypothetical protein SCHPADRAFT_893686 [Schizopora paradoxa]